MPKISTITLCHWKKWVKTNGKAKKDKKKNLVYACKVWSFLFPVYICVCLVPCLFQKSLFLYFSLFLSLYLLFIAFWNFARSQQIGNKTKYRAQNLFGQSFTEQIGWPTSNSFNKNKRRRGKRLTSASSSIRCSPQRTEKRRREKKRRKTKNKFSWWDFA